MRAPPRTAGGGQLPRVPRAPRSPRPNWFSKREPATPTWWTGTRFRFRRWRWSPRAIPRPRICGSNSSTGPRGQGHAANPDRRQEAARRRARALPAVDRGRRETVGEFRGFRISDFGFAHFATDGQRWVLRASGAQRWYVDSLRAFAAATGSEQIRNPKSEIRNQLVYTSSRNETVQWSDECRGGGDQHAGDRGWWRSGGFDAGGKAGRRRQRCGDRGAEPRAHRRSQRTARCPDHLRQRCHHPGAG